MNKGRVEAFTDAVVAIILTIMVLEFKVPDSYELMAILHELPYLFAYLVSFLFIGVAWYNHHYMFALAKRITKRIYWINNFWLFTMSLIPVATAWVGRFLDKRVPEYFYLFIFVLWSIAYYWLSREIALSMEATNPEISQKIRQMAPYRYIGSFHAGVATLGLVVLIYFYPPSCLLMTLGLLIYMAFHTNKDSDQVAM